LEEHLKNLLNTILNTTTLGILALVFPIAALAQTSGTLTLNSGQNVNLDAGTVVSSGGDLSWNGTAFTPQGSATALNGAMYGVMGASTFSSLTEAELSAFSFAYSNAAVTESSLGVGGILAVFTNGGNYSALLVTAQSGTSVTFQFTTFGSAAPSGPTIKAVVNNYGFIPAGFPNSGIALGTLFIISGSGLADPSAQAVLQNSMAAGGLPKTLNGASVSVSSGGTTVTPAFYYAISTALAVVLPSNTPVGAAQVTVTYNNQPSNAFSFNVVATAPGFDTYYGTASGLGVATNNSTGVLYNYNNSIPPSTIVTLWGSGLGADAARDAKYVTPPFTIDGLAHVYVGGVDAQIIYQGASGFPGLNQVDITMPANAPTGCNVSVVGVTAAGEPTNFITLPIGNGPCSDPLLGINGGTLTSLSGQTTVNSGVVFIDQETSPQQAADRKQSMPHALKRSSGANAVATQVSDIAFADFESYTGTAYGTGSGSVSIGGCIVEQSFGSGGGTGTSTGLNAGTITVSNPSGTTETLMSEGSLLPGFYTADLPAGYIPTSGGTFTFTGSGGSAAGSEKPDAASAGVVGPFTAQVTFPNPLLTWTNQSAAATITRSAGVTVTWTGGSAGTYVIIGGSSSSGSASGDFTCIAPVAAGTFTVPSYVTAALPASTTGSLAVENETVPQAFTATGLDHGTAIGYVAYDITAAYN
jgi:fibronectin-binding autotransporter adhesin